MSTGRDYSYPVIKGYPKKRKSRRIIMARFTNYATLSYSGGTVDSNTVVGELIEVLSASKTAVSGDYNAGDDVTYVISLVNSGSSELSGLTVTDDLGGYTFNGATVYPLEYKTGTLKYYINGVLQAAPTAISAPPLAISGISVPAGGNAILVYEATVTGYAPLGADAGVTNTATVTGGGLSTAVTASETVNAENRADLNISKSVTPVSVLENGELTYTFIIENYGNTDATATDDIVMTDTFTPILSGISVTYNGAAWTAGTNYTYDENTGAFASVAGQITVPAATYAQNADGTWSVTPGIATITISGSL